ncbi:MAG: replication-relaxation family protein [Actinomycetota bacterium]|nr:replication-relaxation family protein [Actinomycetota bacterium]
MGGGDGRRGVAARLSSIDHQLLVLLNTHRVLTTPQLIALTGRPERTVDYRLSRLRSAGLVERTRPYAVSGSAPFFWWLTRSGARLVEGTSPAPGKATPNPLFLRHTAAIAGLYVALGDVGPIIGMRCESWLRDELAWEEWSPNLGRAKHLRPDAYVEVSLEVDGEVGRAGVFVEVDFATMDQPRLRAKVARHRDYAADRPWWDRHPGCPPLLLLTTSEARVTRFLANVEKDRPKQNRYDGDDHEFDWEELVAAAAAVGSPEAALSAPVWRTSPADAPVILSALLAGEVRKYRRLVANVRARRALHERYQQAERVNVLAEDPQSLASALGDQGAGAAVRYVFEDRVNEYARRAWAEEHLELVTATDRWWVSGDGRSGWPPPPEPVVLGWQALYRDLWASQARTLLANVEAIAVDDPRLCRPATNVGAGELVREWTLTKEGVTERRVAEAEAAADYEIRREAAIADHLRQLPLHRRVVASEAALVGEYDARHLAICTDCGIARHERDDPYDYQHDSCPVCAGPLVPTADRPEVLPPLTESIATIRALLADLDGGR